MQEWLHLHHNFRLIMPLTAVRAIHVWHVVSWDGDEPGAQSNCWTLAQVLCIASVLPLVMFLTFQVRYMQCVDMLSRPETRAGHLEISQCLAG